MRGKKIFADEEKTPETPSPSDEIPISACRPTFVQKKPANDAATNGQSMRHRVMVQYLYKSECVMFQCFIGSMFDDDRLLGPAVVFHSYPNFFQTGRPC